MRRAAHHVPTAWLLTILFGPALVATTAHGLTLKDVQQALKERGTASWTARDSGVQESLGIGERANPFGLEPTDAVLEIGPINDAPTVGAPTQWDWRNVDGVNWVSPVKNQGKCGSCVAFATVGVTEAMFNIAAKNPALNLDLSEEYLFGAIGACGWGSQLGTASSSIKSSGTVDEACLPYMAGRLGTDPQQAKACADAASRTYKTKAYQSLSGDAAVKAALLKGPVMTSMTVYEDFMFYGGGVYEHVTGASVGGHALAIVGFNDAERYWIVKNSWATTWGENGYFRIRYGDASGLGTAGYAMQTDDPGIPYRITSPAHLSAAAGTLPIALVKTPKANRAVIEYSLTARNYNREAVSGTIPADTLQANIPIDGLANGSYEFKINTAGATHSDNVIVIIANSKPNVTFALVPTFAATGPIKDRVYFSLKTTSTVPLTHAELHVRKADGSVDNTVTAMDPGPEAQVGWRTTLVPNGDYDVWAVGKIGDLYDYTTPAQRYTVQNGAASEE